MGNRVSKPGRKLPSSNITKTSVNLQQNSPNKIQLQNPVNSRNPSDEIEQSSKMHNQSENKNVDKIKQLRVEEIPIQLDQNVSFIAVYY